MTDDDDWSHNGGVSLREYRAQLRGATVRADVPALLALLASGPWPKDSLQLIGEAVLVVAMGTPDASTLARQSVAALEERGWEGDAELVTELVAAGNGGLIPLLRPVPVDLEDLGSVVEGDPVQGGGRIDLRSGEVWPHSVFDDVFEADADLDDDDDDDDAGSRWLWVDPQGSHDGYRDMELFIGTLDDGVLADRLALAITGRGAFRRFKDAIAASPGVEDRWYAFSEDRVRGRARAWLAAQGYRPAPTYGSR